MKTFLSFFDFATRGTGNRFDRYYAGIAKSGVGYPTADEARKDLRNYQNAQHNGWTIR
ncbi:MAG TPA: hypothetical protein VGT61_10480 [Thermomicrobiales bacterium]|jgi:hypothetical protein|nr:hypothetical protein [Thermomicrobiales bacterium]